MSQKDPEASYGEPKTDAEVRRGISKLLHREVAAMNVDNFVVRPRRRVVEKYARPEAWTALSAEAEEAKRLPSAPSQLATGTPSLRTGIRASPGSGQGDRRSTGGEVGQERPFPRPTRGEPRGRWADRRGSVLKCV